MSAETVPRLPAIKSVHAPHGSGSTQQQPAAELPDNESEKTEDRLQKATSYISRVRLGSVHKQPRPGDVYRPRTSAGPGRFSTARPLGLIPDRGERMDLLKELTRFFSPVSGPPGPFTAPILPSIPLTEEKSAQVMRVEEEGKFNDELAHLKNNSPISTTFKFIENKSQTESDLKKPEPVNGRQSDTKPAAGPPISSILRSESPSPYRLHQYGAEKPRNIIDQRIVFENDPDYIELLVKCNIKDYYGNMSDKTQGLPRVHRVPQSNDTFGVEYPRRRSQTFPATGSQWNSSPRMTKLSQSKKTARLHERSRTVEYFNFSGQAKLWNRNLTDDRRDALDYIPCERCRLRGGRCARCKAIRTGGGYIILDGDDLQRKFGNLFGFGDDEYCYGHGADDGLGRSRQRTDQDRGGDGSLSEVDGDSGRQYGDGSSGLGQRRGTGSLGVGGGRGGYGDGKGGDGDGRDRRLGRDQANKTGLEDDDSILGRNRDPNKAGDNAATGKGVGGDEDGSQFGLHSDASGRLGSMQSGSRPASTLDSRPGSSMKKVGVRGSARSRKRNFGVEKQRGRGQGEEDESGGSDGEGRGGSRSRRRKGHGDGSDDEGEGRDRADYKFSSGRREGEDDEETPRSYADLMRFKKKRDDVKALHATMKELQGIDPLDYLAKYCIIDQVKLPHYQHAYDNVDRDEDDEIDIAELDFALKAVNYDLISDAEMTYVHSILELAGRYKLNFRLFSLIAALSEKVVALEDMVKRLINKMDFEALEVKMKKCKELFYLLADTESSDSEGGVVTTMSLAVELQAGGLTEEHVEFVVDRLNHEDKGIVEFLDYLTYVPLFVEIHDTISGNPLDFSRTK